MKRIKSVPLRKTPDLMLLRRFPLIPQRTAWTCGPAVVCAVSSFIGKYTASEKDAALWMNTNKIHGTTPANMKSFLIDVCKVNVQMRRRTPLFTVRKAIDQGNPVIVLWNDWKGHWAVVVGYGKGHLLLADPANSVSGLRLHKASTFRKHWHAKVAGTSYHQLALICTRKP